MNLYEYQKNVINICKENKCHSQLISMPTGTEKTITFLSLAKDLAKKTLILVHREELLRQTYEKAKLCGFKEDDISICSADKKEKLNILNIAMVQSLNRNLEKYLPEDVEVVIVDEAHHATANSYSNIFNYFKIFEEKKYIFGFTATPMRGDRDHLSSVFHEHSFKMTLSEATRLGYIVPANGIRIEITKSLSEIEMKQGDYDLNQLEKVMNCDSINDLIVEKCKFLNKTPAIIFTTSVNHTEELAKKLRLSGRKSISVSYKTSKKCLSQIFRMLERGSIDFITNAVKLSEGFDFPRIQGVILARPTRSPVLYKQMIGRGLRNYPDKYDCFVMEFTSNDTKMMKWEDIDECSTFQSGNEKEKKTIEEAKIYYNQLFKNPNIKILDVRISPFNFYECRIMRIIKHKNFFYVPFEEGFCFYERNIDYKFRMNDLFNLNATILFWKEKYKSFYVWDIPNVRMNNKAPVPINEIPIGIQYYSKANDMGKWYKSELEPISRKQIMMMKELKIDWRKIKSSRKAEMEIEDKVIKKAIDNHLSRHEFSGLIKINLN